MDEPLLLSPHRIASPRIHFDPRHVGKFNPASITDGRFDEVVVVSGVTIWRCAERFIDSLSRYASRGPAYTALLLANIPYLLMGTAFEWYCEDLDERTRAELWSPTQGIGPWKALILARFRTVPATAMVAFENERYTIDDLIDHKDFRSWVSRVKRKARLAGYKPDDIILFVFLKLDVPLQEGLRRPTTEDTLNDWADECLQRMPGIYGEYAAWMKKPRTNGKPLGLG